MRECLFFRLAGILKLRKKAGESSSKWFFVLFFFFFVSLTWIHLCSLAWKMLKEKNRLSSSSSFLPSSSHYCKAVFNIPTVELFNCSSFLLWCRYRCDSFFQSSCVLFMIMSLSFSAVYLFDDSKRSIVQSVWTCKSFCAASKL